jgi:hypothetical protein
MNKRKGKLHEITQISKMKIERLLKIKNKQLNDNDENKRQFRRNSYLRKHSDIEKSKPKNIILRQSFKMTSDTSKMQTVSPDKFSSDSNSCKFTKSMIKVTEKQLSESDDIEMNFSSSEQSVAPTPTPKAINKAKIKKESISESFNSDSIDSYFQEESKNDPQNSKQRKDLKSFL